MNPNQIDISMRDVKPREPGDPPARHKRGAGESLENGKRYLDINEVAEYIGVSKWTVSNMVNKRQFPFIALSKRAFRFDRLKVDKWMEKKEVKTLDYHVSL